MAITNLTGEFSVPTVPEYLQIVWTPTGGELVDLYYGYITSDPGDLSSASLADLVAGGFTLQSIPTDWTNAGFNLGLDYLECTSYYLVICERSVGLDECSNVTLAISACNPSPCYNCKGFWSSGKGVGGKSISRV